MCVLRCQEHQHVHERTAEWTTTLHWNTVMPEQTTETNESDRCKYIHSAVWREDLKLFNVCTYRCQEHQHVHERTAEWTTTLHWSTAMPEQTTETNESDRCKYIHSTVWRDFNVSTYRCQEYQHVHEKTAEWTTTLHWSTVMPEQTTETNEPDRYKYILSTVWWDGFKYFFKNFLKN